MNEKGVIYAGLVIFLAVATFPFWYRPAAGKAVGAPDLEMPAGQSQCVEDRAFMLANHMDLLNQWRDKVVREGEKTYKSKAHGTTYDMSLTRTCLDCHASRQEFCQKCHSYTNVEPTCWGCHLEQKGK